MELLSSIEDIDNNFTEEVSARKYLADIRWGQWAICPKCGNSKCYFIENGTRFKCANNKCYFKFSVITKTLMACSNLKPTQWIKAVFIYSKKRGRATVFDIEAAMELGDHSGRIAGVVKNKLDFAWKYVNRELTGMEMQIELFKKLFTLYEQKEEVEKATWANPYHISDITNVSDPKEFGKLLHYCKIRMYFCSYIYIQFATPGEIMTEVFLFLHDQKIKDYDADYIVKIINRTIGRMWYQYKKEHPNVLKDHLARQKDRKRDSIRNLKKSYLVESATRLAEYSELSRSEIKSSTAILNKIKDRIKEKRIKSGGLVDFNSHFD